jgi:hypothetical protein
MDDARTEDLQNSRRPTEEHGATILQKNEGINPPASSAEYQLIPESHVEQ